MTTVRLTAFTPAALAAADIESSNPDVGGHVLRTEVASALVVDLQLSSEKYDGCSSR